MTPRLRRFTLTAHVTLSVGWLGAVVAYLALALAGLTTEDARTLRAAFVGMELIGWFVIVPASLAALLSGLVQSLGTEWGLFRHYWIAAKFTLAVGATVVLLVHMQAVSRMADLATQTIVAAPDFGMARLQLVVHAAGGLLVLLAATTLSIYKPWGRTPHGRRKLREQLGGSVSERLRTRTGAPEDVVTSPGTVETSPSSAAGRPWGRYVLLGIIGLALLLVIVLHLTGRAPRLH